MNVYEEEAQPQPGLQILLAEKSKIVGSQLKKGIDSFDVQKTIHLVPFTMARNGHVEWFHIQLRAKYMFSHGWIYF